jgi:hypothetical protein
VLQSVQKQAKAAACEAIKPVLQEFLEAEVCAKLGREKGESRHSSGQPREIDWPCGHCGCQDANQFTRDGHYRRGLETGWGHLSDLRVPMLECQKCQHDVIIQFALLEKYKRFWMDLDQDVLFGSGFCESLRQMRERWSATVEGSVGLRTLNERIKEARTVGQMRAYRINSHGSPRHPTGWHLGDDSEPTREDQAGQTQTATQATHGAQDGDPGGSRLLGGWQARGA